MFNPEVSDPYALLKAALLEKSDLTDRQRLDESLRNIELGSHSTTEVLARMREVIGARIFDDGLFRELFLSKLPQPVQTVLVTLQSVPLDDLAASADKTLQTPSRPVSNAYSICDKPERQDSEVVTEKWSENPSRSPIFDCIDIYFNIFTLVMDGVPLTLAGVMLFACLTVLFDFTLGICLCMFETYYECFTFLLCDAGLLIR
ncbi:unnamed protein product [Heterobilharzia americana]|nr:unnamed protein product [Heterobilharzia americana]